MSLDEIRRVLTMPLYETENEKATLNLLRLLLADRDRLAQENERLRELVRQATLWYAGGESLLTGAALKALDPGEGEGQHG